MDVPADRDATGRHAVTVWDHLNGKLQGPPRERIIMPEEVARWRELRRRGWTYQRIAAGSGWTEAAVYMRLTGRGARSELPYSPNPQTGLHGYE